MNNVHTVTIGERLDGTYVFENYDDAQAFKEAAEKQGETATYDEQIIIDREFAKTIIGDREQS